MDKMIKFKDMDGEGENQDFSDFYYQNDFDDDEGNMLDHFLENDEMGGDETGDGDAGGDHAGEDHPGGSILEGETAEFERIKELTAGEDGDFQYFPAASAEVNNQKYAVRELHKDWGPSTEFNIGVARSFLQNFLSGDLIREAHVTGIGSHPLMILAFYKAARTMERLATGDGGEAKTLKFKGMNSIKNKKLEERAKDLAIRAYLDAKNKIIEMHGGIKHG